MKTVLRAILPDLLMVVIMAALALAFMSPVFEGKVLYQNDILQAKDMAQEVTQYQKQTGEYPGWTNSAFSGMPTYQIKSAPSGNIFQWLFQMLKFFLPGYTVAILFVCMLGFYFLLRTLKLSQWLALAGAIAFGFGAHNLQLIGAGHVSKIYAMAYMAPVIAGMFLVFKRKYLVGGLVTSIGFGVQLVTNHPQVSYYLGIIILVYMLVELIYAIREKYFDHLVKAGITLFVALILAVLPNMTALMTTREYSKESTRGESELVKPGEKNTKGLDVKYITDWSYGISETMNLFIPNFCGGGSSEELGTQSATYKAMVNNQIPAQQAQQYSQGLSYWGSQTFTSGPHYIGAITVFLAVLGLFIVKGKKKWWLVTVIVLSVLLSWGRNFIGLTEFFVNHVPLYSKFRDVTNTLIIAQFAIPLLAFLAVKEWFADVDTDPKVKLKKLSYALGIAGGIAFLVMLVPAMFGSFAAAADGNMPGWLQESLRQDRMGMARTDALRTLIFVLAAGGILWLSLKSKAKKEYLYIGLALFILVDMWSVGKRYLNNDNFISKRQIDKAFAATPADTQILGDKDLGYRVFDLTADPFRSARASRFHQSIGGYHGAKLGRYQDLIDKYLAPDYASIMGVFKNQPTFEKVDSALARMNVLNMLNTKYLIANPSAPIPNSHAYGDSWFINRVTWADNANQELDALGTTALTEEAVVDKRFRKQLASLPAQVSPGAVPDAISLKERKPNYLKYDARTAGNRLAVFSQIYYPYGWKAFMDGKETEYIRADYAMRALLVPAGKHTVEFRFEPQTLKKGKTISLVGSFLILLLVIGTVVVEAKNKKMTGD